MMADFEIALDRTRALQAGEAHELRQDGFRRQDKRIEDRAELTKEGQSETSTLLTALIASGDTKYAMRLKELNERVGLHHSATIEALLENQERLDAMQQRLEHLLGKACVLPDGRRVFRSEDGVRVEDEFGVTVSVEELDPNAIEDYRPSLETWEAARNDQRRLEQERAELIDYQNRLDQAQTLIDQGGLSDDDFEALDDLMTDKVPDAVRSRLPTSDPAFQPNTYNSGLMNRGSDALDPNTLDLTGKGMALR